MLLSAPAWSIWSAGAVRTVWPAGGDRAVIVSPSAIRSYSIFLIYFTAYAVIPSLTLQFTVDTQVHGTIYRLTQ